MAEIDELRAKLTSIRTKTQQIADNLGISYTAGEMTLSEIGNLLEDVKSATEGGTNSSVVAKLFGSSRISSYQLPNRCWVYSPSAGLIRFLSDETTDLSVNTSLVTTSFRAITKIKLTSTPIYQYGMLLTPNTSSDPRPFPTIWINTNLHPSLEFSGISIRSNQALTVNSWYYITVLWNMSQIYLNIYSENGELVSSDHTNLSSGVNSSVGIQTGFRGSTSTYLTNALVDLNEFYFEIDGSSVWGTTNSITSKFVVPQTEQ